MYKDNFTLDNMILLFIKCSPARCISHGKCSPIVSITTARWVCHSGCRLCWENGFQRCLNNVCLQEYNCSYVRAFLRQSSHLLRWKIVSFNLFMLRNQLQRIQRILNRNVCTHYLQSPFKYTVNIHPHHSGHVRAWWKMFRSTKLTSGEYKVPFLIHRLVSNSLGLVSSHVVSVWCHKMTVPKC
jgi:hypothetical protein